MNPPAYVAPEVQAAREHAIPDPLPAVLAVLQESRPDLAAWLAAMNPRPERSDPNE